MLKHRSRKFRSTQLLALCLLVSCGFALSCEDDYVYDDEGGEPSWLGSSIYAFLQESGNYTNYVRMIEDLNYAEVLNRTGSKTLFITDDEAFAKFYADNKWNVRSYEELSAAQKKIILYNSMLDNAYLLNMMSSTAGSPPREGTCLRQLASASVLDSVAFFTPEMLPQNNKYWDRFRESGVRLMTDGTDPMMLHFLKEYLSNNNITDNDFAWLFYKNGSFAKTRSGDEAFIFGNKVLSSGVAYDDYSDDTLTITCKNGYMYRMDGVLVPPSNMAEEIRTSGKTNLFSRMLDRFTYPIYNSSYTSEYNRLYHPGDEVSAERVYEKRYFASAGGRKAGNFLDDDGVTNTSAATLPYDPGWNQFYLNSSSEMQTDMAAMYVPSDDKLREYFTTGGGKFLIDRFGGPRYGEDWPLERSLDSVPLNIIQAFLANLMKTSFNGNVPSKFDKVTNDANDPMGVTTAHIDECLLANNGVVYVLNTVFGPAKYVAVSAPPLVQENMRIVNFAITSTSYLLNYNSYLLAMDSYFSFVVPGDDYFVYYDPVTKGKDRALMYTFRYGRPTASSSANVVWAKTSTYDPLTYEVIEDSIGTIVYGTNTSTIENRLHDMMEYFIVVGDFDDGNRYYLTKGYGTIKVETGAEGVSKIYGGEQLETGREVNVLNIYDQTEAGNGKTYLTDGVPAPPTKSVYAVMGEHGEFSEFFDLCNIEYDSVMYYAFPNANPKTLPDSIRKYSIFYKGSKTTDKNGLDFNVNFFSTYHYTVYIPDNDAMNAAYAAGLPRPDFWEELADTAYTRSEVIAAKLRQINKFVRYHFQDNSVFVDNLPFSVKEAGVTHYQMDYETAALNENTGRFYNLRLETLENTLTVTDTEGNRRKVKNDAGTEGSLYNIMARDLVFNTQNPASATAINTSSFAALHLIDGVLLNDGVGSSENGTWRFYDYVLEEDESGKITLVQK